MPPHAAQMPSARARSAGSRQVTRTIASDAGISSAAPAPASARPAISTPSVGASAQTTDAPLSNAAPATNARRRP